MSQPKQIIFSDPNADWCQIDNSVAPSFPTQSATKESIGYDTTAPGANSQGSNPTSDTGSTTLDPTNDTIYADPSVATFAGNPVSQTAPAFKTVSTIVNSNVSTRLLWKNPAVIFFGRICLRSFI